MEENEKLETILNFMDYSVKNINLNREKRIEVFCEDKNNETKN